MRSTSSPLTVTNAGAFLADQIASHQDILNFQYVVLSTATSNPRLADLSRRGDALVRANLAQLQALQAQMPRPA